MHHTAFRGLKIAVQSNGTIFGYKSFVCVAPCEASKMTDEQLAIKAVSDAQRILEEYLEPRPRNNERLILDKLVEVLERPDLIVAVTRMQSDR
jgi:hypothetical protein